MNKVRNYLPCLIMLQQKNKDTKEVKTNGVSYSSKEISNKCIVEFISSIDQSPYFMNVEVKRQMNEVNVCDQSGKGNQKTTSFNTVPHNYMQQQVQKSHISKYVNKV